MVDEFGNAVKYENDEIEEDTKKVQLTGNIVKYLGQMKQGEKNPQSTKVDKKLVKARQNELENLMNKIEDDDDSEKSNDSNRNKRKFNNSNNKNFNKSFTFGFGDEDYIPEYSKRNIETKNTNADLDIDIEDVPPKEKPQKIKREKKVTKENENNNNAFNYRSGIKRTIKQQVDLAENPSYSNTFSKSNFNREPKETSTLENSESKDNSYSYMSFNKAKYRLPLEKDNSIKMFWYDAIEESFNNKPNVIFFGKIYEPQSKSFLSISVIIKDIYRTVFILPKPEYESDDQIQKVYEEFDDLRKKRFNYIKEYQCKNVEKKYCFELPVESKDVHKVLKIKYKAEYGTIPPNLNQKTFDYIFGKKSSLLENILLKLRIKGPCWLKIKNFTENNLNFLRTWSDYELSLDDFKNIEVITKNSNGSDIPIPPMKLVSISTQSIRIKNGNELYCICCALKEGYHVEDTKGLNKVDDFKSLIFARKIDNKMSIFKNSSGDQNDLNINLDNIPDLNNISKLRELLKIGNVYLANDEKSLLITFITKISAYDPDIIVGHNLNNKHLDLILSRISFYKTPNWTKLSHFKRSIIPNHLRGANNSEYCRNCLSGRLLCDTFENTKDILFKETNYDLRTICEKHLNLKNLPEIEPTNILINLSSVNDIKHILQVTMDEAYYTLIVMDKFQILPLTLQLTSIAGCLWTKSLQCSRAARCEMLLLHQFYEQNYLFPDKYHRTDLNEEENRDEEDDDDDGMNEGANNNSRNQRRKPQYSGGLVLEPHPGLYDDIILVMDFNSLYPSIIQEYNISFETVIRKATQSFKEDNNWNNNAKINKDKNKKAKKNKKADKKDDNKEENNDDKSGDDKTDDEKEEVIKEDEEEDEDKAVEISDKIRFKTPPATLPSILRFLVGERRNVKNQQKIEKDKFKRSLLEIKQKSLKISANSLYGYLGYKNSRFYAKEIAALITKTGRRILRNAAHIVDKNGYKIIYGDTDSVMVNTMTQNIKEAVEIGNKLNKEINKQYKLLIIDIDGVFKSMLLLKKKKYACLKYLPPYTDPNKIERELKGVDLVRRDWSPLSKNTGLKILDIILSGKSKDDIIIAIYDELKKVSEDIDNNKIELKDYAITKQLAKNIDDYHDLKALPHVQVAKRLREQGKRNFQIHSFIPYVICLFKEDENNDNIPPKNKTISDRAYHPKEIENDPTLKIDYLWYKENQILPVVKRLVQHINEITLNQLCESLGIENKAHDFFQEQNNENSNDNNNQRITKKRQVINLKVRSGLLFKCPHCNKIRHINILKSRDDCIRTLTKCEKCKSFTSKPEDFQKIANIIKNTVKNLIFLYYRKKSTCSICKESNNTLFCRTKCSDKTCNGYMEIDYDEMSIYHELKFLNELVNTEESSDDLELKPFNEAVKKVENYIKNITKRIAFTKINISELFSFLNP